MVIAVPILGSTFSIGPTVIKLLIVAKRLNKCHFVKIFYLIRHF